MCHWKKWFWPGLLTVGLLTIAALWLKSDLIENDLKTKATAALTAQGQQWAEVEMDGRDAILRGAAPSEGARETAALVTDQAYDVRVVSNQADLIAAQSPYTFSARRDGDAVELDGFVPDEPTRAKIVEAAKTAVPGAKITDKTTLARGAPAGFDDIAGFGLNQLSNLTSGEMSLSDAELSIKGSAPDQQKFGDINTALAGVLPSGASLALKEITAPVVAPYTWSANYSGGNLELSGHVPNASLRQTIVEKAKSVLPAATIADNQLIASGVPEDFEAATGFALEQLPRFSNGMVSLSDKELSIAGVSKDSAAYREAKAAIAANLPAGLVLADEKIVPSTVAPYTWSASYDGNKVTLGGYVPDDAMRQAIVADTSQKLPDATIDDQMQTAVGAPDEFQAATSFAIGQLQRFSSGSVSLSDADLTVNGISRDGDTYSAANAALSGSLPAGIALKEAKIQPATVSPYTWGATFKGSTTTLTGYVPNNETRERLMSAAKEKLGGTVVDEMMIANGQPDTFEPATSFALDQLTRFSQGSVSLSDLNLTVEGTAKDGASFEEAKAAVASELPAALSLAGEDITPPIASPYTWSAQYGGSTVELAGFAPDAEVRDAIETETRARFPQATVNNKMQIAAGAPDGFQPATAFALDQLPRFSEGSVRLSDLELTVEGKARDSVSYDEAKAAMGGQLPVSLSLASENITPPTAAPYTWSAEYDGSTTKLNGFAPSSEARDAIEADAKAALPESSIDNQMQIAVGAPDGFNVATRFALSLLPRFSKGSVSLNNLELAVKGVARDPSMFSDAKAAIGRDLPAGLTLKEEKIEPPVVTPYPWSARYNGKAVTLDGFVPSEESREKILAETKAKLPNARIIDNMQIAGGAPPRFDEAAPSAIALLQKFSEGSVDLTDQQLRVKGKAKSEIDYSQASDAVKGDLGGLSIAMADIQPAPPPEDYVWEMERRGKSVILSGFAPTKDARREYGNRAKRMFPDATIVNRLVPRADAPEGFVATSTGAQDLLAHLNPGKVSIVNKAMNVAGTAASVDDFETALSKVEANPGAGYKWDVRDIKPASVSPYIWAVERGADNAVQSGFVPSRKFGNSMVALTTATLVKPVTDNQRIAVGQPENFENAVAAAISAAGALENSRASISDTTFSVQGRAPSESEAAQIRAEVAATLPPNFSLRSDITFPEPKPEPKPEPEVKGEPTPEPEPKPEPEVKSEPAPEPEPKSEAKVEQTPTPKPKPETAAKPQPEEVAKPEVKTEPKPKPAPKAKVEPGPKPATQKLAKVEPKPAPPPRIPCEVRIRRMVKDEKIQFATDRALIRRGSIGLLNRIAEEAQTCPDAKFEIWGHTDARGNEQYNQQLSQARARSVASYLAEAGVTLENMKPIGYGELRPLRSNETIEGRAANRRIEFVVVDN